MLKQSLTAITLAMSLVLTGCATKTLIHQDNGGMRTFTEKQVLIDDRVLAFGTPSGTLANVGNSRPVVIVGEKQSYVLTQGSEIFLDLLPHLDARYIHLTKKLEFMSENKGTFTGELSFKYSKLKSTVTESEKQLLLQHDVRECSTSSDERLNAQTFCFDVPLSGVIYPAVSNQTSLKALSKAYPIKIYTYTERQEYRAGESNPLQKIVLLPFAVAFDVVTLPFQALNKIFD